MTEAQRLILAGVITTIWLLGCVWLLCRHRGTRPLADARADLLVAYASQSGNAAALARQQAQQLAERGRVNILPLNQVSPTLLKNTPKALFVVSTYGEGEPPDNGRRFSQRFLKPQAKSAVDLSHLRYSVIALGDRNYAGFCAFGHQLYQGLAALGAQAEQPLTEIDAANDLMHWQLPAAATPHTSQPVQPLLHWQLCQRQQLNPGSTNAPLYLLSLSMPGPMPVWRAGDVLTIQPKHDPQKIQRWLERTQMEAEKIVVINQRAQSLSDWLAERHLPEQGCPQGSPVTDWLDQLPHLPQRQYSVASVPAEGVLKLIVRLQYRTDGGPGTGSGWLTRYCMTGEHFAATIQANVHCHIHNHRAPLLLIGAGSGLAGMRAQLMQRAAQADAGPVWLIFGERSESHDNPLAHELDYWRDQGLISRLDKTYSQGPQPGYVQYVLNSQAGALKDFMAQDGEIYLCGNKSGMGDGVHQCLQKLLGEQLLEQLTEQGRYHRDLY
ncbi:flavodoxin domain-containing protein [Lacimicrobium alkaliphilum]|uniref:NADPH--hemoprotein reductase n=1 Tax=Lacimicrobium alkaliphilum TaxID=1526571 RepID=A0ABQ1RG88_9ALTE|nr:flavodoxin domain-containing protein [Lacimicrobium alkaliphilum]GGD69398.1 sulfite reductase subunit alpha [Lacimicrobium alkaliphilum]